MKFGKTRAEAAAREAAWAAYRADVFVNNRPLYFFVMRWTRAVEGYVAALPSRRPRHFIQQAFIEAGGLDRSRGEVLWAIQVLEQCWQYSGALKGWADAHSTWMR